MNATNILLQRTKQHKAEHPEEFCRRDACLNPPCYRVHRDGQVLGDYCAACYQELGDMLKEFKVFGPSLVAVPLNRR